MSPSPNGRASNGRFTTGNAGGPGNPHAARVARLRAVLLETVTDDDLRAIVARLVAVAKAGDIGAVKELFDRLYGKPTAAVAVEMSSTPDDEVNQATMTAVRQQLLNEPDYLRYLRAIASRDAGDVN